MLPAKRLLTLLFCALYFFEVTFADSLIVQAAVSLAANNLDIGKTLEQLATVDTLKSMAIAGGTAGITRGISDKVGMKVPGDKSFDLLDRMKYNMLKSGVGFGTRTAIDGGKVVQNLVVDGVGGLVDTGLGHVAEKIGDAYKGVPNEGGTDGVQGTPRISSLTHKGLHGLAGGVAGGLKGAVKAAVTGDDVGQAALSSVVSGAFGSVVTEIVAEAYESRIQEKVTDEIVDELLNAGETIDQEAFEALVNDRYLAAVEEERETIGKVSKLATVGLSFGLGIDPQTAIDTGSTTLENNFIPHLVVGAVWAGGIAWTAYDTYKAYQDGGAAGALKSLAVDGVIAVVTGGAMKLGGKIVKPLAKGAWQYGKTVFPTAEKALEAVVQDNKIFGKIFSRLSSKSEKQVVQKTVTTELKTVSTNIEQNVVETSVKSGEKSGCKVVIEEERSLAVVSSRNFTRHALERMEERKITTTMVDKALSKGRTFWDQKNNVINYVLDEGFASGKSLIVGQDPVTKNITTVIPVKAKKVEAMLKRMTEVRP